jgi:small conductance mechanosensitive channel
MTNILDQLKHGAFADPAQPIGALVYAVVFALFAWLVGRALRLAVQRVLARDKHAYVDRTAVNFLAQLAQIGVWLFAFISYAHLVPPLARLGTAWLASVGVISVVLGLAAQNTLGNLIAGISLLLYRPFKVGDRVQVTAPTGLETGVVESLNLGYTVLKTDDNRRVVIPNSAITSQTTINLTGEDPRVLCSVSIGISHDSDIDKARAILLELARRHPQAREVSGCSVTQFGPAGVVLTLGAWCADSSTAGVLKGDLLEQAAKRLAAEGLKLPFPQTVVTLILPETTPRAPFTSSPS